ncbi:leucine-rich receptor-like protein kinase family protein [Actinidia rufa]|uniref:non-specific serine/threonine protein kinase n=1 Tax=Actinidia rufa TaxID=165716 RepID=A0A7J0FBH1_9ERIC|nr:leucine-rich receptor-like protein kinase family protein [Actinidia rufa]
MSAPPTAHLTLLSLLSLFSLFSVATADDLQILLTVKSALQNPNTYIFNSWEPNNSPCNFAGVTCSQGSITSIDLANQQLSGSIPFDSICQLQSLETLSLGQNHLHGPITEDLKNCVRLQYLDLGNNFFSGSVPDLSPLTNLKYLHMNNSGFSGNFPWNSLSNMTGLLALSLGDNAFERALFPNSFLFRRNSAEISRLKKLWQLELYNNSLTGKFPSGFGNLTNLENFDASMNNLNGDLSELRSLTQLVTLQLFYNEFSGKIPAEFGEFRKLVNFSVYTNKLTGPLPERIGSWAEFDYIDVSENSLTGRIPPEMCKRGTMKELLMLQNNFSGDIPATYANCTSLTRFRVLVKHSMMSTWHTIHFRVIFRRLLGLLPGLNSLDLSKNELSGEIPASFSLLRLSLFDLSYNQLTGPIPESLSNEAYNGSFAGNRGLCSQNIKFFRRCSSDSSGSRYLWVVVLCVAVGAIVLIVSVSCVLYLKKSSKGGGDRSLKEDSWDVKPFQVLSFTEDEVIDSIKQENLIGKGGSGNVYKVVVANGKELAVKHIWNSDSGGRKKSRSTTPMLGKNTGRKSSEFDAEVRTLSSIRHVNVVKLYCSITSEDSNLLVYEYMPNGSLWDRLHTCRKMTLDWETRYDIAVGAAKGLEYLHHGCERPVIHRDVKSSNILLDEVLKPRIADFGLAKIIQANASKDSTHVIAGTHGYIAPEYGYTYKVSEKSDVYSFGVVLMELVTGKRPIEPEYGENKDIVNWVSSKLKTKESVLSMVDSTIPEGQREEAIKILRIAILCTARLPALRPTMRSVVQMLEEAEPCKLVGIIISKDGGSKKEDI